MNLYSRDSLQQAYKMLILVRKFRELGSRQHEHSSLTLAHDYLNFYRNWEMR